MKAKYLIDTVVLIEHFNGLERATKWLSSLKRGEAVISVITLAEILVGAESDDDDELQLLLDGFNCLHIKPSTAKLAADLRRNWHWKLPDAFQAATALENQLTFVTKNTKDFSPEKHKFVLIPY